MQLSTEDRAAFFRRTTMSLGMFFLLASVSANIFFLVRPPTKVPTTVVTPQIEPVPHALAPRAFGTVSRILPVKVQKKSGTSSFVPVASYVVPPEMLSAEPAPVMLYRNQGIVSDETEIDRIFTELGAAINWRDLLPLPLTQRWRTADRTMELTLDIEKRALTVSKLGSFAPSPEGPADNDLLIAIAYEFASSLGVQVAIAGSPTIVERPGEGGASAKTYVVWPLSFDGKLLIDTDGNLVPGLQVQVGRQSRKALSMTFTLLSPDRLSSAEYPAASRDALTAALKKGGLRPVGSDLTTKSADVTYTEVEQVYLLLPADADYPMYIIPALRAKFSQGTVHGMTYVPTIDPTQFLWEQQKAASSSSSNK